MTGSIDFASGAIGTIIMSFDVWKSDLPLIEIQGTKGSIKVPDPNGFGGTVKIFTPNNNEWQDYRIVSHGYTENSRGIGAADLAYAIRSNRSHRASGELANHVLDAMLSFKESWKNKKYIKLKSTCKKPTALPEGLAHGTLDA